MLAVLSTTSVTRKQDSARAGRGSTDEPARSLYRPITSLHSISTSMKLRMDALQLTLQHDMDLMKVFSEITPGKAMQYFHSFRYLISSLAVSYFIITVTSLYSALSVQWNSWSIVNPLQWLIDLSFTQVVLCCFGCIDTVHYLQSHCV